MMSCATGTIINSRLDTSRSIGVKGERYCEPIWKRIESSEGEKGRGLFIGTRWREVSQCRISCRHFNCMFVYRADPTSSRLTVWASCASKLIQLDSSFPHCRFLICFFFPHNWTIYHAALKWVRRSCSIHTVLRFSRNEQRSYKAQNDSELIWCIKKSWNMTGNHEKANGAVPLMLSWVLHVLNARLFVISLLSITGTQFPSRLCDLRARPGKTALQIPILWSLIVITCVARCSVLVLQAIYTPQMRVKSRGPGSNSRPSVLISC